QLQFAPSLDFASPSVSGWQSTTGTGEGSLFESLLSQLTGGTGDAALGQSLLAGYGMDAGLGFGSSSPFANVLLSMGGSGLAPQYASGMMAEYGLTTSGKPTAFEPFIQQAAAKHGISPTLIKAVIDAESSFDPNAVSSA